MELGEEWGKQKGCLQYASDDVAIIYHSAFFDNGIMERVNSTRPFAFIKKGSSEKILLKTFADAVKEKNQNGKSCNSQGIVIT